MSDICAIFRLDDGPVGSDDVRRLLGADDGAGVWAGGSPPAPAGLGGRVTAFTPEDEFDVQPVCSRDGQVVLVADARVDNRADKTSFLRAPKEAWPRKEVDALHAELRQAFAALSRDRTT